jgi:hypothetical protein
VLPLASVSNTSGLKRGGSPGRIKGSKNKLSVARVEDEIRHIATFDPRDLFAVPRGGHYARLRAIQTCRPRCVPASPRSICGRTMRDWSIQ